VYIQIQKLKEIAKRQQAIIRNIEELSDKSRIAYLKQTIKKLNKEIKKLEKLYEEQIGYEE